MQGLSDFFFVFRWLSRSLRQCNWPLLDHSCTLCVVRFFFLENNSICQDEWYYLRAKPILGNKPLVSGRLLFCLLLVPGYLPKVRKPVCHCVSFMVTLCSPVVPSQLQWPGVGLVWPLQNALLGMPGSAVKHPSLPSLGCVLLIRKQSCSDFRYQGSILMQWVS